MVKRGDFILCVSLFNWHNGQAGKLSFGSGGFAERKFLPRGRARCPRVNARRRYRLPARSVRRENDGQPIAERIPAGKMRGPETLLQTDGKLWMHGSAHEAPAERAR